MQIEYEGESGLTVYAIVRTEAQVYNPATAAMDDLSAPVDHPTYALSLSESANVSGYYSADATLSVATHWVEYWAQVGATAERSDDARLGSVKVYWDGEKEWEAEEDYLIYAAVIELRTLLGNDQGGGVIDLGNKIDLIYRRVNELYSLRNRSKQ